MYITTEFQKCKGPSQFAQALCADLDDALEKGGIIRSSQTQETALQTGPGDPSTIRPTPSSNWVYTYIA